MRKIPALLAVICLSGCVSITGAAMKKLQPGMTKEQALAITGPSDGYQNAGGYEIYTFTDRPVDINSPNRGDFQATFKDGRLVSYGSQAVRQPNVGIGMVGVYGNVNTQ